MDTQCGEQNPRVRLNPAILHELYSEHIFRKPLEKNAYTSKHERRKCLNFCEMKNERTRNKHEYYIPVSVRTLRVLHLMFALADSPDRMSIAAQGSK